MLPLLKPEHSRACAQQQEKRLEREARALQTESSPHSPKQEKSLHSNEDPAQLFKKKKEEEEEMGKHYPLFHYPEITV